MKIGFTGTREGMTNPQKRMVARLLRDLGATEGHHGDCVGADEDFHNICVELGLRTVSHPPSNPRFRAYCEADETRPIRSYLVRNRYIVRETEILVGGPKEYQEPDPARGQGTWSTIRYARVKTPTYIVWPTGKVQL